MLKFNAKIIILLFIILSSCNKQPDTIELNYIEANIEGKWVSFNYPRTTLFIDNNIVYYDGIPNINAIKWELILLNNIPLLIAVDKGKYNNVTYKKRFLILYLTESRLTINLLNSNLVIKFYK